MNSVSFALALWNAIDSQGTHKVVSKSKSFNFRYSFIYLELQINFSIGDMRLANISALRELCYPLINFKIKMTPS